MLSVQRVCVGPLQTNCWILSDTDSRTSMVVDPAEEPETILAAQDGNTVSMIVVTHRHDDHKGALPALLEATGAEVFAHAADAPGIFRPLSAHFASARSRAAMQEAIQAGKQVDHNVNEGDELYLGPTSFRVIHTPGHTPGSMCLYCAQEHLLIAGDTLFAGGSYGRCDLAGGDFGAMKRTLAAKFVDIPDDVVIMPGHGPISTFEQERRLNPYLV